MQKHKIYMFPIPLIYNDPNGKKKCSHTQISLPSPTEAYSNHTGLISESDLSLSENRFSFSVITTIKYLYNAVNIKRALYHILS